MSDLSGTILGDKYELSRLLGEGGMGAVYEAKHTLVGKRVAVKLLHAQFAEQPDVVTRFHREAQAAAAIGHENIADVIDMGRTPAGDPYLVMEFLEGSDLKHLLETSAPLPLPAIAHIMVQALEALQAAHSAQIIHRDLKPENIFIVEKRDNPLYVKLLDFGISKFKSSSGEDQLTGLTRTGTVMGTPHFMSPEQASGDKAIDHRTDIYAMGVILYQMCTGALPYTASTYNALIIKIFTETPPEPQTLNPALPAELVDTILTAMARDPDDRFADCLAFRERLLPYLSDMTGLSRISSRIPSAIRPASFPAQGTPLGVAHSVTSAPSKPGRAKWALVAVAAATALSIGLYVALSRPSAAPTASLQQAATAAAPATAPGAAPVTPTQPGAPSVPAASVPAAPSVPTASVPAACEGRPLPAEGPGSGGCAGQLPGEHMQWVGNKAPMFADVDKDGADDIIGWIRFLDMSSGAGFDHIGAFNVKTGERFWKTGPIVDLANMMHVRAAVIEDKLLVADATGTLRSFAIEKGQLVWTAVLGERAERICSDTRGYARVETKDQRGIRVAMATGQLFPEGAVDDTSPCRTGGISAAGYVIGGGTWNENDIINPEIEGMDVDMVIVVNEPRATLAVGHKTPGTQIPAAARYDGSGVTERNRAAAPAWLSVIPTVPPLTVAEGSPEIAAAAGGVLFVPYGLQTEAAGARLAGLDIQTGQNRWDVPVPFTGTGDIQTIAVTAGRVFVSHWTYLNVFDSETGQHQMTLGIW